MTSFKDNLLRGRTGEETIANCLKQLGYYVIPSYDYTGDEKNKAPKIQGLSDSFVIPDLDIAKDSLRLWAEVKTKAKADWTRKTQQLEHGIDKRHYDNYLRIQQITGCTVYLYIFEESTLTVLYNQLDKLTPRFYDGGKMGKSGMVFFPRSEFFILGYILDGLLISPERLSVIRFVTKQKPLNESWELINQMLSINCKIYETAIILKEER